MFCNSIVLAPRRLFIKHACVARLCFSLSSCPPLPANCRADPEAGGSPEHVFDTMVMELDQRLEKVGGHAWRGSVLPVAIELEVGVSSNCDLVSTAVVSCGMSHSTTHNVCVLSVPCNASV